MFLDEIRPGSDRKNGWRIIGTGAGSIRSASIFGAGSIIVELERSLAPTVDTRMFGSGSVSVASTSRVRRRFQNKMKMAIEMARMPPTVPPIAGPITELEVYD